MGRWTGWEASGGRRGGTPEGEGGRGFRGWDGGVELGSSVLLLDSRVGKTLVRQPPFFRFAWRLPLVIRRIAGALRACVGPGGTLVSCKPWTLLHRHPQQVTGSRKPPEEGQRVPMAVPTVTPRPRWKPLLQRGLKDTRKLHPKRGETTGARGRRARCAVALSGAAFDVALRKGLAARSGARRFPETSRTLRRRYLPARYVRWRC